MVVSREVLVTVSSLVMVTVGLAFVLAEVSGVVLVVRLLLVAFVGPGEVVGPDALGAPLGLFRLLFLVPSLLLPFGLAVEELLPVRHLNA